MYGTVCKAITYLKDLGSIKVFVSILYHYFMKIVKRNGNMEVNFFYNFAMNFYVNVTLFDHLFCDCVVDVPKLGFEVTYLNLLFCLVEICILRIPKN